jgi:acyl carrier protein
VTLRVGESAVSHPEVEWQPVGEAVTLDEIRGRLRGARGEAVGWRELVNPRLHVESRLLAWLDRADAAGTVGDLRRSVSSGGEVTPGALSALAAASGWTLTLTWSPGADEGQFDAVFSRGSGRPSMPLVDEPLNPRPWGDYATNPLRARLAARLGPALTTHVATRLPAYMVPSAWVLLEAMPLTANGKVDRRALPAPDAGAPKAVGYVAPRDELESALAAIWSTVLGGPRVGVLDSFFDLGGHSLTATQLVARVRRELGAEISIVDVFQQPTVAALATVLRAAARRVPDLPPAAAVTGPVPLSAAQRRLWIIEQMRPGTAAYNMAEALRLEGPLAPVALRAALAALVDRHETLRTVFEEQGDDVFARVGPPAATGLTEHDVNATADPEAAAHALAAAEAVRPFDLRTGPLVRATLIRLGPQSHVLVCVMHHIVTDALSQRVLLREFAALYAAHRDGRPSPLPALPATHREFARWQATELAGPSVPSNARTGGRNWAAVCRRSRCRWMPRDRR